MARNEKRALLQTPRVGILRSALLAGPPFQRHIRLRVGGVREALTILIRLASVIKLHQASSSLIKLKSARARALRAARAHAVRARAARAERSLTKSN